MVAIPIIANGKPHDALAGLTPLEGRIKNLARLFENLRPIPQAWIDKWKENLDEATKDDMLITDRLDKVTPTKVDCLWKDRIPLGKLTIVQGNPGEGKTWMVLDVIRHVTRGTPFSDGAPCISAEVLFATAEDGIADTIRPRLDLLRADVSKVYYLDMVRDRMGEVTLDLDKHLKLLVKWLQAHPAAHVLVLDPLAAFLGKVDSHKNSEVRGVLGRLAKLAENYNVAVVAINHLTKDTSKAIYRSIGSIAFVAAARAVWQVSADRDDPDRKLFLPVKMNLAHTSGLAFRLTHKSGVVWEKGEVQISADDAEAEDGETPRAEAKEWLRDILKPGPMAAGDLQKQAKDDRICLRTLEYAKKELGIVSKRRHGMWSWGYAKDFPKS